jgi:hypothetical protein
MAFNVKADAAAPPHHWQIATLFTSQITAAVQYGNTGLEDDQCVWYRGYCSLGRVIRRHYKWDDCRLDPGTITTWPDSVAMEHARTQTDTTKVRDVIFSTPFLEAVFDAVSAISPITGSQPKWSSPGELQALLRAHPTTKTREALQFLHVLVQVLLRTRGPLAQKYKSVRDQVIALFVADPSAALEMLA